jgi:hypothetical protein
MHNVQPKGYVRTSVSLCGVKFYTERSFNNHNHIFEVRHFNVVIAYYLSREFIAHNHAVTMTSTDIGNEQSGCYGPTGIYLISRSVINRHDNPTAIGLPVCLQGRQVFNRGSVLGINNHSTDNNTSNKQL